MMRVGGIFGIFVAFWCKDLNTVHLFDKNYHDASENVCINDASFTVMSLLV